MAYPPMYFNNVLVTQTCIQKRIGLYLNENLNYKTHIKEKLIQVLKGITVILLARYSGISNLWCNHWDIQGKTPC